jgi:hypothetical protein
MATAGIEIVGHAGFGQFFRAERTLGESGSRDRRENRLKREKTRKDHHDGANTETPHRCPVTGVELTQAHTRR